jgi:TPR repeat protein
MKAPHYQSAVPFGLGVDDGEAQTLYLRGLSHFRGEGAPKDPVRARELQHAAAGRGLPEAQFELSLLLRKGIGGKRDTRGAKRWEEKAAEAGHPRASLNRASRLASARKPDYQGAVSWYERAAGAGNAEAAARLCKMHLAGQGMARDEIKARAWFERAAALGYDWSRG